MSLATLTGILGLAAIASSWALAVLLYRVGTPGSIARKLALLLVFEGVTLATAGFPQLALGIPQAFFDQHPVWDWINYATHASGDAAFIALYPAFLAASLQTKLVRPFAGKGIRIALATAPLVLVPLVMFGPSEIAITLLFALLSLLFGFALVASIHAWYVAQGRIARTRARIFALAFGLRDLCWGFVYGASIWQIWSNTYNPGTVVIGNMTAFDLQVDIVYALGTLLAVPLIAYGILRGHLFDIDLKIRWTIKQSTVAGVFVAVMFVISEGTSQFLSDELGKVTGLLAAGVLMFFLAPLQRFAERVAATAMPKTHNTPEYAAFRKMQVYEAAVTEAQQEGGISHKERALLVRLRDSLGISESDAEAIELELESLGQ